MNVYAESSAVISWLLGEYTGNRVRQILRRSKLGIGTYCESAQRSSSEQAIRFRQSPFGPWMQYTSHRL